MSSEWRRRSTSAGWLAGTLSVDVVSRNYKGENSGSGGSSTVVVVVVHVSKR